MKNSEIGMKVVRTLRENMHEEEAFHLEKLLELASLNDPVQRTAALDQILGLCSIRSCGDLSVSTMNGWAWSSLLNKLRQKAARKRRSA